jgi:hypothetical protein
MNVYRTDPEDTLKGVGQHIAHDPRLCHAFLRDYRPLDDDGIKLLVNAAKAKMPDTLAQSVGKRPIGQGPNSLPALATIPITPPTTPTWGAPPPIAPPPAPAPAPPARPAYAPVTAPPTVGATITALFSFEGRVGPNSFLKTAIPTGIFYPLIAGFFGYAAWTLPAAIVVAIPFALGMIPVTWIFLATCAKRWHDLDISGWRCLAVFAPPNRRPLLHLPHRRHHPGIPRPQPLWPPAPLVNRAFYACHAPRDVCVSMPSLPLDSRLWTMDPRPFFS